MAFESTFKNGKQVTSEGMRHIWFYGIIGLFVLLLACIISEPEYSEK
jgi:hypothetical protein